MRENIVIIHNYPIYLDDRREEGGGGGVGSLPVIHHATCMYMYIYM